MEANVLQSKANVLQSKAMFEANPSIQVSKLFILFVQAFVLEPEFRLSVCWGAVLPTRVFSVVAVVGVVRLVSRRMVSREILLGPTMSPLE